MHYICAVEYTSGYKLRLKFDDCIVRAVDLERHLDGEIFEPLKDIRRFRTARLDPDLDTVVWDNGADMSPDFLYEIGIPVQEQAGTACAVAEEHASYGKKDQKM
ncbi:MAG: DUF2442 domain-containing protein [Kiritimatiellia bacterium]|jgi:hypothetical protein